MEDIEVSREEAELEAKKLVRSKEFTELMTFYKCAIMEVETKLNVLNQEFSLQYDRNPFESIETRLKDPVTMRVRFKGFRSYTKDLLGNDFTYPIPVFEIIE